MGIHKSLFNDDNTVDINGTSYHFGQHPQSGNWLIEHSSNAKDYWSFETQQQMLDFIELLPCSAEPHGGNPAWLSPDPNWVALTPDEMSEFMAAKLQLRTTLAAAKRRNEITIDDARHELQDLYRQHTQ
jgi:hypothetical protein